MKTKQESKSTWRVAGRAVALVTLPLVALMAALAAFSLVLRHGGGRVRDEVRAFNKRVLNPAMMKLAGRRHWYASVLRHKGRRSGREYATPVVAVPIAADAFIIPLPYGEVVDWLKNVLAAKLATVESKGETCEVAEPEVIGAEEALPLLDARHRRTWRRFGIERYLKLKRIRRDPGAPRWEELHRFRAAHPPKLTTVEGVDWEYVVGGRGEEALLILPGGAMVGEAGFTRMPAFEDRYRVIAPSYASVSSAAQLLDGLAGVLDAEGVRFAHVLGPSYGGIVAQGFVRRHPERVGSLILANTLVPPRRMLRLSKIFLALLPLVPVGWLRTLRERGLSRAFYGVPGVPAADQAFWRDYQHGLISRMSQRELRDLYRLGVDLIENARFTPEDLASWPGRVFILESDADFLAPEQRAELRRLYPRADVYTIHGAGHTPWMSHKEEYLSAVNEFLAGRVRAPVAGASLEQRLQDFRRAHPYKEIEVGGLRWRYVVGGQGERTLLLPSGGTRVPDMYLLLFEALEPHFRVISPAYPAAHTMDALVEGSAAVLDAEGIEKADLFGSSFGGFVAQCFVRRYPERVRSLILANTGAPSTSPLPGLPLMVRLFAHLSESVVRRMTRWNWRRWFAAPPEQRAFWYGLIDEILATRLTKGDLICALEEMLDYGRRDFGPDDLDGWPGRILIIESENDKAFSPEARKALRTLYPKGSVRTFADAGHAVMVTDPAEYIAAVRSFLEDIVTTHRGPAAANTTKPPAAFPLQRPGRVVRALFKAGARVYRGPLARLMGAYSMLLLTTTARRSGLPRTTALTFQLHDGCYLVLAGMGVRSDWYRNLLAEPRVEVQIGTTRFAAVAEPVLDPERRRMLAPGIGTQWDRFGPPRPARWLLRRLAHFDYDAELDYALAHAEDLPMVELVPSGSPPFKSGAFDERVT